MGVSIIIAGGDEAGRGAVLGPLVISVVAMKAGKANKLSAIGIRDSKMLTPKKREFLYDEICDIAEEVKVYKIGVKEINSAMLGKISLNELEAIHFAKLLDSIESSINRLFLDSPDVVQYKFGVRVGLVSKKNTYVYGIKAAEGARRSAGAIRIISEHKADLRYPITSAASIIAKVERDREIAEIKGHLDMDIGSGYPSDNKTVDAIRDSMKSKVLLPYIRSEWQTMKDIKQSRINEFMGLRKAKAREWE
jgi:ribonuclease HII